MEKRNFTCERERLLAWANYMWTRALIDGSVDRVPTENGIECSFPDNTSIGIYQNRWVIKVGDYESDEAIRLIREADGKTVTFQGEDIGEISYIPLTDINGNPVEEIVSVLKDEEDEHTLEINIDNPNVSIRDILRSRAKSMPTLAQQDAYERIISAYDYLEELMPQDLRYKDELIDEIIKEQEEYKRLDKKLDLDIEL